MLSSLRSRLILTHLGIVVLAVVLLGLLVVQSTERAFLEHLRNELFQTADILKERLGPDLASHRHETIEDYLVNREWVTPIRVRVVDAGGVLVGSTEPEDQSRLGAVLDEAEVVAALRGERTIAIAPDQSRPGDVLYVAAPVHQGNRIVGGVRLAYQLVDFQAELQQRRVQLAVAVGIVAVAGLGLGLVLALTMAAPLRRLALAAQAVAAGDFAQRADLRGPAEIAGVGHAFDLMAERLGRLEANRRALLGAVSHDLHTLATGLGAAAEALQRGAGDDRDLHGLLLAGISGHSQRLTRLADDLLQAVRHEAGGLVVEPTPVEPASVARQVAAELAAIAGEQGVLLESVVPAGLPEIMADSARLVQALGNLVENAIRYSPVGEVVRISVDMANGWCRFTVSDRGPGLAAEARVQVLEPAGAGQPRGRLGLGLSIAQAIAETHGGRFEVTSSGGGSTFVLAVPASPSDSLHPLSLGRGRGGRG